jgi:two-component system, response regulator YesN
MSVNLSEQSAIRSILKSDRNTGSIEMVYKGERHRYSYLKSDPLGWVFIGDINYGNLLGKVNEVKRYILTVTTVMLCIVALCGVFFTKMIYSPIQRLLQSISRNGLVAKDKQFVSEFDLLAGTFRYLEHKVQDLQNSMAGYRYSQRRAVLHRLTVGGWRESEMDQELSEAGISLPETGLQVCMLRLDSYGEWLERYSPNDIALLKYAVCNIADELAGVRFTAFSFDEGEDRIVILFNIPEGSEPELMHVLRDIQGKVKQYLKLSISASIGSYASNLMQVPSSREVAHSGSRYRISFGPQCLIPPDIEYSRETVPDGQSSSLEKQVTDYMKLGDSAKTVAVIEEYIGILRRASYDEMMMLLTQLLFAVSRSAKAMAADSGGFLPDIGTLGQQLYQWESLEQIRNGLVELCEAAIRARDKQSSQKNVAIVDKLKRRIHNQFKDPNLSVDSLAEYGGLSVNYMRKVFKDIEGISITQYITECRFEKVKELLLTTDLPANRIGEMVGFENTKYFYGSFKKYSGKTPDHFRKCNDE